MLWNIAIGGRKEREVMNPKLRLYIFLCRTDLLDESTIVEMLNFVKTMEDNDITVEEFHKLILSYTYTMFFRDRNDGSLRGLSHVRIDKKFKPDGSPYTVLAYGLAYCHEKCRGGPYGHISFVYFILRELLTHPLTPLYVNLKTFVYTSYCNLIYSVRRSYPRYDEKTPKFIRDLINTYGAQAKESNETYNKDTFILERVRNTLKKELTALDDSALKDPHIKFFTEVNPNWAEGNQLVLIGCVEWWDIIVILKKIISRTFRGRKRKDSNSSKLR